MAVALFALQLQGDSLTQNLPQGSRDNTTNPTLHVAR
jgi:hypothetical protein